MLTDTERAALAARLRRSRQAGSAGAAGATQIPRRPADLAELPLSYGQEQLWFLDRFAPGLPTYNLPLALALTGPLDTAALGAAVDALTARHEALRTRLVLGAGGRPVQVIDPPPAVPLPCTDLSGIEPPARQARLRELIETAALVPFDLAADPMLRTSLIRLAPAEHILLVVVHHVVFDGWSAGVLLRDLAALYQARGGQHTLPELPVQFADYAIWERDRLRGATLTGLENYWRATMTDFPTVQFPTDRPRPVLDSFDGELVARMTGAGLLDDLRVLSRGTGVTLPVTLLAALSALLSRYTGQTDLVIGTYSANRGSSQLAPLAGFLVNTLPIRADLSGDPRFTELLARLREAAIAAYAHQDLPFAKMVEALGVARDPGRPPVFQIALNYAERDYASVAGGDVEFALTDLVVGVPSAKFDLNFLAEARPGGLWLECCYKTGLFDRATIDRLLDHFEVLLRGVVADPATRVSALPVLTAREWHQQVIEWNDTDLPIPVACLHTGFEAQVLRTPDAVAAEFEGECWSYATLNQRANQVARWLRAAGVRPEALVGVCMTTGLPRLAVMLGIWKASGAYVPMDPAFPAERLAFMIADAGMSLLLTDEASVARVPPSPGVTVRILDLAQLAVLDDADLSDADLSDTDLGDTGARPENVAYVLYTSGSTGQPKGVLVEHRQTLHSLHGMNLRWQIDERDVVLQFSAFTFDVSIADTYMGLLVGARILLAAQQTLHSPPRLAALMRDRKVTVACLAPAVISLIVDEEFPDLRVLMSLGAELPSALARRWLRPGLTLVNDWGPSEVTIGATCIAIDTATQLPPPIGRPKPNYQVYVLDPRLNPLPIGAVGELHVGGAGVTRGYLNLPEQTLRRYVPDPFRPGQRLYRTGDLGRQRPDGSFVFGGRIDHQVKLRGLRIELGEIETVLARHPAVAQVVATLVTDAQGEQHLAAYLRYAPGAAAVSREELRDHLGRTLPAYMIPTYLIAVEQFPLNANRKIDRSALPAPAAPAPAAQVEPATVVEAVLTEWYAGLLNRHDIGATDGFFDLGGNSLLAMRLVGLMNTELEVDIGVASVFLAPAPRQLAALLRDQYDLADTELGEAGIAGLSQLIDSEPGHADSGNGVTSDGI